MDYMDYSQMMNLQLFLMEEDRLTEKNKQKNKQKNNNLLDNFLRSDLYDYDD